MSHETRDTTLKIKDFTDLTTWQEAHKLILNIYKATDSFPESEQYALVNQMRRAAVSITSNVAEGFSRRSKADRKRFYVMAHGSLTELQNQLFVARDVNYLEKSIFERIFDQSVTVHKLLTGLIKATEQQS